MRMVEAPGSGPPIPTMGRWMASSCWISASLSSSDTAITASTRLRSRKSFSTLCRRSCPSLTL